MHTTKNACRKAIAPTLRETKKRLVAKQKKSTAWSLGNELQFSISILSEPSGSREMQHRHIPWANPEGQKHRNEPRKYECCDGQNAAGNQKASVMLFRITSAEPSPPQQSPNEPALQEFVAPPHEHEFIEPRRLLRKLIQELKNSLVESIQQASPFWCPDQTNIHPAARDGATPLPKVAEDRFDASSSSRPVKKVRLSGVFVDTSLCLLTIPLISFAKSSALYPSASAVPQFAA